MKIKDIQKFWQVVDAAIGGFFYFADRTRLSRRAVLWITIWLTIDSYRWGKAFADAHANLSGAEMGLIIGAVLAPLSGLAAWVFHSYQKDSRSKRAINSPEPQTGDSNGNQVQVNNPQAAPAAPDPLAQGGADYPK